MKLDWPTKRAYMRGDMDLRKKGLYALAVMMVLMIGIYVSHHQRMIQTSRIAAEQEQRRTIDQQLEVFRKNEKEFTTRTSTQVSKPVDSSTIDEVQKAILNKIKADGLEVQSVTRLPAPPPAPAPAPKPGETPAQGGQQPPPPKVNPEFEITVTGSWEATMKYLYQMEQQPYLTNIRSIRMEAQSSGAPLRTSFRYRLYVL